MPRRAAALAEVCPLRKGHTAGSVIYKKQQISPVSVGDLAQGLAALPHLQWRDSEWKRKSWHGEIPGAWRGRRQHPPLSKDLLSAPCGLSLLALLPQLCQCHHHRTTAVIAVPPPSSLCHRCHCHATAIIAVPPLSLLCHHHHHRATAVIAVPPLSSPCHHHLCQQGTRHRPNLLGRVAGSGSLLCKLAFWVVTAFWGPGRNRLSPRVSGWVVGASTLRVCGQCQCWSNLLAPAGLPGTGSVAV